MAKKKKAAQKAKSKRAPKRRAPGPHVPRCTRDYLRVLADPIGSYGVVDQVCVPDSNVIPSTKLSFRVQGTFTSGTSGVGFITMSATNPASNNNLLTMTSTASVGNTNTALSSFTNLNSVVFPTPWANTDDLQYKIVGAGLRTQYIGTELNKGGDTMTFKNPHNEDDFNDKVEEFYAFPETYRARDHGQPFEVVWAPVIPTDYTFRTVGNQNDRCMTIVVNSATPSPQPYLFEAVVWYEFIGEDVVFGRTKTHSDPIGFAKATEAVQSIQNLQGLPASQRYATILSNFFNEVTDVTSSAVSAGRTVFDAIDMFRRPRGRPMRPLPLITEF